MFPKSELLQSLITSYFQNGALLRKKHVTPLKGRIFRRSYYYRSIEIDQYPITQSINQCPKILKHDKNEFLCLPDDVIALMTSSFTKNRILQKKMFLDNGPMFQQRGLLM